MNRDPYATALNNALTEIQKAYPDITHSFIFNEDGSTIAGETQNDPKILSKVSESFEELKSKTKAIGSITSYSVNCENGKLNMININGMYLMLATNSRVLSLRNPCSSTSVSSSRRDLDIKYPPLAALLVDQPPRTDASPGDHRNLSPD